MGSAAFNHHGQKPETHGGGSLVVEGGRQTISGWGTTPGARLVLPCMTRGLMV